MGKVLLLKTEADLNRLFKRFYPELCRYAFYLTTDKAIAEDMVQELFISLWEKRDKLNVENIESYLYKAVKNKSINFQQSYYRKNFQVGVSSNTTFSTNNTNDEITYNELDHILKKAVNSLPAKCREIFYLKRFKDLSHKEVSKKLNVSEKTVENQMTIALRKISAFLDKNWK